MTTTTINALFLTDILQGLSQPQKTLPAKYFYDERGSALFEKICETEDYYVTRTELAILNEAQHDIASRIGPHAHIIEPGSGAGEKIQILLSCLDSPATFVPLDISSEILQRSATIIRSRFPTLTVLPIQGDFFNTIQIPDAQLAGDGKRVVFFPGSTIGNFTESESRTLLKTIHTLLRPGDLLIIGIDLMKSPSVLEAAYNDRDGITAAFNLNLLHRINAELGADIDIQTFEHVAWLNVDKNRIEMHLRSTQDQTLSIAGSQFTFSKGETIHTENSHKYSLSGFTKQIENLGFSTVCHWTDSKQYFSSCCFSASDLSTQQNTFV